MNKLIVLLIIYLISLKNSKAQVDTLFFEDFNSTNWSMQKFSSKWMNNNSPFTQFWRDTVIKKGLFGASATDTVGLNTESYLVTPPISLKDSLGLPYLYFGVEYDHICYIDFFDQVFLEYKIDTFSWKPTPVDVNFNNTTYSVYTGPSQLYSGRYFSKLSNQIWPNANDSLILTPLNSINYWVKETFDLSRLIEFESINLNVNPSTFDSISLRIGLIDNPASYWGRTGTHQYWIDNFAVLTALSVGQSEIIKENQLKLYPNPSKDQIQIKGLDKLSQYQYRIFNIEGKIVEEGNFQNNEISLQNLENGIYFLEVFNSTKRRVQKFIKE